MRMLYVLYASLVLDMNIHRVFLIVLEIMLGAVVIEYMNMGKHFLEITDKLCITFNIDYAA